MAFCKRREGATTVRELQCLSWTRGPDEVVTAAVSADAFCHSMVRSLVGALLAVGRGQRPVGFPAELLHGGCGPSEVSVAPAHGLTLVGVDYPPADRAGRPRRSDPPPARLGPMLPQCFDRADRCTGAKSQGTVAR